MSTAKCRVKLYKGNVVVVGRASDTDSLFDASIATFEDDGGAYNQKDAEGFIKLNALTDADCGGKAFKIRKIVQAGTGVMTCIITNPAVISKYQLHERVMSEKKLPVVAFGKAIAVRLKIITERHARKAHRYC